MDSNKRITSKKNKKIAIFHCAFVYSGGGERIVLEEARELKNRGYEVSVYAPTVDYKKCFPEMLNELDVKMFLPSFLNNLPFRNALRMLITSIVAPFFAFKFKDIDIFMGCNQPGVWIAFIVSKILRKPYIVYLNQPNRIVYPRPVDREFGWYTTVKDYHLLYRVLQAFRPILLHLDKLSIQLSNAIFVNGGYIGGVIENVYSRSVIDNPAGSHINEESSIHKNYLLITNRHDPQKRFDYVILALKKVLKKYRKTYLIIPGPFTEHTKSLIKLSKKLGIESKVKFIGCVSETKLQELYKYAAVYCYPSPEEDFGLGPIEAGSWGIPTVAWNHAGPTVTVENGHTGYLAEPYDVDDYADKIVRLLKDKKTRDRMGHNAYNRTKNIFNWSRHVDVLESKIIELI